VGRKLRGEKKNDGGGRGDPIERVRVAFSSASLLSNFWSYT
jgi:hypothetical protein